MSLDDFPDHLLLMCLARLPLKHVPVARTVCRRWRHALSQSHDLYRLRKRLGVTEPWTFILANKYDSGIYIGLHGRAVDPFAQCSHTISPLKSPKRLQFVATGGADGMVYVIGGRSPLTSSSWLVFSRVDVYNPVCNLWHEASSMAMPRFAFAAASFVNPVNEQPAVIVAGGYDVNGFALASAEIYDPSRDEWEYIQSMSNLSGACKGEVKEGKMYVKQANNGPHAVEAYDPTLSRWIPVCASEIPSHLFKNSDKSSQSSVIALSL